MKLLFIRLSSIGDIVLTTPVIRCVKNQVANVEIHYLLRKQYEPVLQHNTYVDKSFFYEDNINEIINQLKKEKYDAVIDLHKNIRSFRIKNALGVKHYTFDKINFQKWIMVNLKINLLPKVHIVDRYFEAVKFLGVKNDGFGLDYFISDEDDKIINSLPLVFQKGYIAWVIGARHNTKRLPIEKIISISKKIISPIVLLGGKEDFEMGEIISAQGPEKIFNACGKFSLNQSAALVKHSRKVITHDTGLMHIASAFKKDIISIWGNTIPEFGMYPYFGYAEVQSTKYKVQSAVVRHKPASDLLEVKGLSCRPCSKIGFEKCPRGHFKCMREIDESVFNQL